MLLFELEEWKNNINLILVSSVSNNQKAINLFKFFEVLLNENDEKITSSYIDELIDDYLLVFSNIDFIGYEIDFLKKALIQLDKLQQLEYLSSKKEQFSKIFRFIEDQYSIIVKVLSGEDFNSQIPQPSFPILESNENKFGNSFGYIESINISLIKSDSQQFFLIPSDKTIEKRLEKQIENSWSVAYNYAKKYIKILNSSHKIIISFKNKFGYYEDNSLGIALTIAFLKEIFDYYKYKTRIKINDFTTTTGSIDEIGEVFPVTEGSLKRKLRTVFFSPLKVFGIPNENYDSARKYYLTLKQKYPERKLKLAPIESTQDILNRRDFIEFYKIPLKEKAKTFFIENKLSFFFIIIISVLFTIYSFLTIDNNPTNFEHRPPYLFFKNDAGDVLWKSQIDIIKDSNPFYNLQLKESVKILDVNSDGLNEVFITRKIFSQENKRNTAALYSYDNSGAEIYRYNFETNICTSKEQFLNNYRLKLIDIFKQKGETFTLLGAFHIDLYPSAFFKFNLKTGEKVDEILLHPGHANNGIVGDFNQDGNLEFLSTAINNGLEQAVLFSIDLDKLKGRAPSTKPYEFLNHDVADFNYYIKIPKSDYSELLSRYNRPYGLILTKNKNILQFVCIEVRYKYYTTILYFFNIENLKLDLEISDVFHKKRDDLIREGKLNKPFSNTKEFKDLMISKARYWDGKDFLPYDKYIEKFPNLYLTK